MKSEITLTETDLLILESYRQMIDGLGEYLGTGYEIILHNLGSYDHSVIAIQNGHYTGRKIGAPITNMALDMLESIKKNSSNDSITYFTTNRDGKPMKSTTIAIRGEQNKVIGLLCINFYLDVPFSAILDDFTSHRRDNSVTEDRVAAPAQVVAEEFSENSTDLIHHLVNTAREQIYTDNSVSSANKNKAIIQTLHDKGVFHFKDAVQLVAEELNISKNTVYLHLRNIK